MMGKSNHYQLITHQNIECATNKLNSNLGLVKKKRPSYDGLFFQE